MPFLRQGHEDVTLDYILKALQFAIKVIYSPVNVYDVK